ncbi:Beta-barrel assembly machine subunit BamE [Sulfitobacter brevis]|uniref:Beta-barrel assembly machine subunit BamE n=1 Tax=Sulfitobacter brevis TaxID=74348 RepID=A0A1I1UPC5_9RHOB|nr:outer membrane protein assembly factor BamE [Sulfitobacter brevis]SFD72702.1 Beta-barrel assembly machine subunit BamE [Sulfitobacter brevis]
MRDVNRSGRNALRAATCAAFLAISACTPQFENHGYVPLEADLQTIQVGQDTRDSVAEKIGVPTSSGVLGDGGYYYVRTRLKIIGPFEPREIEREVVAISFTNAGVVQNVERFGLEEGRVVPLSRRVTTSDVSRTSILRRLLGNLGRFNPAGFGG